MESCFVLNYIGINRSIMKTFYKFSCKCIFLHYDLSLTFSGSFIWTKFVSSTACFWCDENLSQFYVVSWLFSLRAGLDCTIEFTETREFPQIFWIPETFSCRTRVDHVEPISQIFESFHCRDSLVLFKDHLSSGEIFH